MSKKINFLTVLVMAICFVLILAVYPRDSLWAEEYPSKPIEFVVAWSPGGGTDVTARIVIEGVNRYLPGTGKMYVTNKPGSSGVVGLSYVVNSKPDGYTLSSIHGSNTLIASIFPSTPYGMDSFEPLCLFEISLYSLCVQSKSPFKTYEDLIDYAKKNPGSLTCSVTAKSGTPNVYLEILKMEEGVDIRGIPVKGSGPQGLTLLGGHVDMTITNNIVVGPHIEAGKLRPLLSFHKERFKRYPNVPCTKEKGYGEVPPVITACGLPAGVPRDRYKVLSDVFKKAMHDPQVIARLKKKGGHPNYMGGKELGELLKSVMPAVERVRDKLK